MKRLDKININRKELGFEPPLLVLPDLSNHCENCGEPFSSRDLHQGRCICGNMIYAVTEEQLTAWQNEGSGRYLLFKGDVYYPSGGARDFVGAFDTLEAAVRHCQEIQNKIDPNGTQFWTGTEVNGSGCMWAHVWDSWTREILEL